MGKYTILDDPRVDKYIDGYLKGVVDALLEDLSDVRSIILAGSFGKGEGSVLIDSGGVKPLRDFDLVVVFREKTPPEEFIKYVQRKLQNRFSSTKVQDEYYLSNDLIPEMKATTLQSINSFPDIFTYDLKQCQVIYGEDLRSQIKLDLKDLPLRTNARALFQKAIALIGAFRSEYLSGEIPPDLRDSFLRETSRAYIEICVGLCLLARRYSSSCIRRLETLREIYGREFSDLYDKIPDLVEKVEASTKYKLDPGDHKISVNLLDYWFETRDDLGEVIKYYYSKYLSLGFENWVQFSNALERSLTRKYYVPVIDAFLRNKNLPANSFVLNLSNLLFNIKENLKYSRLALRDRHLSMPLAYGISSPVIKVFSITPLILFSINRDRSLDSEYVHVVLKKLDFVKLNKRVPHKNEWEEARSKFLEIVFSVNMI